MEVCEECGKEFTSTRGLSMHKHKCKGVIVEPEAVKSSVVEDYYETSPRRLIKLTGLLNRTHDIDERLKIKSMIYKLEG